MRFSSSIAWATTLSTFLLAACSPTPRPAPAAAHYHLLETDSLGNLITTYADEYFTVSDTGTYHHVYRENPIRQFSDFPTAIGDSIWLPAGHYPAPGVLVGRDDDTLIFRSVGYDGELERYVKLIPYSHLSRQHQRSDLMGEMEGDIRLPIRSAANVSARKPDGQLGLPVMIYPTSNHPYIDDADYVMQLSGRNVSVLDPYELLLHLERHRVKLPENRRHHVRPWLYLDERILDQTLPLLQTFYARAGLDSLYLVYQNDTTEADLELFYRALPTGGGSDIKFVSPVDLTEPIHSRSPYHTSGVYMGSELPNAPGREMVSYYIGSPSPRTQHYNIHASVKDAGSARADDRDQPIVAIQMVFEGNSIWNGLTVGDSLANYGYLSPSSERNDKGRFTLPNISHLPGKSFRYELSVSEGIIDTIHIFPKGWNVPDRWTSVF